MLESVLAEHQEAVAVEHQMEHFVYFEEEWVLEGLAEAIHIAEEALQACLDNVRTDPFAAVDLDREDELDVAYYAADRVGPLDESDIFADEDAWANDAQRDAVVVEGAHVASDDRALADAHTSDAADDDAVAVAKYHLFRSDPSGAYDALAETAAAAAGRYLDRDDILGLLFHLAGPRHCCHCLVEI